MYQKYQASQIFTGKQLLEGRPQCGGTQEGFSPVLIIKEDGTIDGIVDRKEAGDDVQQLQGVLTPGFVNSHCHLELSHMKDMIPAHTGLQEFVKQIVSLRKVDEQTIYDAIENAEAEMYRNGIVAVGDICNTLDTLTQKKKNNIAYYNFVEVYDLDPSRASDRFNSGVENQQQYQTAGLKASVNPHAPYSVTYALWELLVNHFGNHTITMHNQETKDENDFFETKTGSFLGMYERTKVSLDFFNPTGKTSVQSMLPYLQKAHSGILVHNSFTSVNDVRVVNQTMQNAFWCLCPNANQYIEQTMPPIELLRSENANIILGTDSYASNWSLSILDEMKTIQKHLPHLPLAELLTWSTINGAKALQMSDQLGTFEQGKKPGVLLIENISEGILTNASVKRII
jgi:cytosine/adenosine deaminase-related metal-dependent hydrolase